MTPKTPAPCMVVIFGATGDLAKRKLLPALYNLANRQRLPEEFTVVGAGREPITHDAYREKVRRDLAEFGPPVADPALAAWFHARVFSAFETPDDLETYASLARRLNPSDAGSAAANVVFYLAVPPSAVADIVGRLGDLGLLEEHEGAWRRVIVEKPFGYDLASARALNQRLLAHLAERQIYRIDHYLGKETVQNLMAFRFANGIFEPVWNRRYIDHVQITVAETVGVEDRGGYYDRAGALRDMVQNHLFQLLALTAMEPPNSFQADAVRDERVKVLNAIHLCTPEEVMMSVVRGQYAAGDGLPGYRQERDVARDSTTETFIALKLLVENWRWADVPFYLRTGKRLPARVSEVSVQFRGAPLRLFRGQAVGDVEPNVLVMRIQPDEGIALRLQAKVPGEQFRLGAVDMDFDYADYFESRPNTGYETLLHDCLMGDQTLFHRADMVEAGWTVVAPILDILQAAPSALLHPYPAHAWGPAAADRLLANDGRQWRTVAHHSSRGRHDRSASQGV
ncbi:MAG: glucose-6-phosphate dehydrogenase [Acidobacteria bacterium]|nr:glucose-6-phosphate dehydrogenase [Acidobacteriota bacterium]